MFLLIQVHSNNLFRFHADLNSIMFLLIPIDLIEMIPPDCI